MNEEPMMPIGDCEPWLPKRETPEKVTPEQAIEALAKAKPVNSTPEYSDIIHEHVERHYTMQEAERMSGLDCRRMEPVSVRPNCDFLRCQMGRMMSRGGDPVFELISCGETWNAALRMFGRRGGQSS